jgi:hypothetical protein
VFANGLFVACGQNNGDREIVTSTNGSVWTSRLVVSGGSFWSAGYSDIDNLFIAVGTQGTVYTSANGTSWTAQTSGVSDDFTACSAGNGRFLAVIGFGATGDAYLSEDGGVTWNFLRSETNGSFPASQGVFYSTDTDVINVGFFS